MGNALPVAEFCWRAQPISCKLPSNSKTSREDLESGKRAERSGPGKGLDSSIKYE